MRVSTLFTVLAFLHASFSYANQSDYILNLKVQAKGSHRLPHTVEGELKLTVSDDGPLCFYLPYNNPEFRSYNVVKDRFTYTAVRGSDTLPFDGYTHISNSSHSWRQISPHLIVVAGKANEAINLKFKSKVPRYLTDHRNQWFYYEFYPQRLADCYNTSVDPVNYIKQFPEKFVVTVDTPAEWQVLLPGETRVTNDKHEVLVTAPEFSFGLTKGMKIGRFNTDSMQINVAYHNTTFLKLIPSLQHLLSVMQSDHGPLPIKHLWFIDALQYERDDLPGMMLLNQARQQSLQEIQTEWMNWAHWATAGLITRQWYGAFIRPSQPADDWLVRGTSEYATLKIMRRFEPRFEMFNVQDSGSSILDIDYREIQDLGLTVLYQSDPTAQLVDRSFKNAVPFARQHAMHSLRHAATLRHLEAQAGEASLNRFFTTINQNYMGQSLTPEKFKEQLETSGIFDLNLLQTQFYPWWQSHHWFDAALSNISQAQTPDGQWETKFSVNQHGKLNLWTEVSVTEENGSRHVIPVRSISKTQEVTFISATKPHTLTIDEERKTYDTNRYNNRSDFSKVYFFPGNARGFPDDAYTVVWLPFPIRRSGQPWSLSLRSGLFRYVNSALIVNLETEMGSRHRSSGTIQQSYRYPTQRLSGIFEGEQNIYGSRKLQATLIRDTNPTPEMTLQLGGSLRHRQIVGERTSPHATYAVSLGFSPKARPSHSTFSFTTEIEHAPPQSPAKFNYRRGKGALNLTVSVRQFFDFDSRIFYGLIRGQGPIPEEILFRPEDVSEARMRLDQGYEERNTHMYAWGNDLLLPAYIPFSDLGVITMSRLKWRIFYDLGRNIDQSRQLADAGAGIDVPLGGDLAGVGTLAVSKISLMSVLYSRVGDEASTAPRLLFNVGSEF